MHDIQLSEPPSPRLSAVPDAAPPFDGEAPSPYLPLPVAGLPPAAVLPPAASLPPVAAPAMLTPDAGGLASPARQFAQAICEAVAGTRPFRQVRPALTERVQGQVQRLIPLLRADSGARIQRILASQTDAGVVEVTVIACFGPRTRALAMRFEHVAARPTAPGLPPRPARWLCTDIATP